MSKAFDMTVTGQDKLLRSMRRFVKIARGGSQDGWMEGVRITAAFVAESLSKRTKAPTGRKAYPNFREAVDIDIDNIGNRRGMTRHEIEAAKHAILPIYESGRRRRGSPRGAWVGDRDYKSNRGQYQPDIWISKDPAMNKNGAVPKKSELQRRWRYQYAGLAKASWLTLRQQARRMNSFGEFRDKIAAVLPRVAFVNATPETLGMHLHNNLRYASQATPREAIADALEKGRNRAAGFMNAQTRQALQKAGLE